MSSSYATAFPTITELDAPKEVTPKIKSRYTYKTYGYLSEFNVRPRHEPEVIIIKSIVLENKKTTYIQKHLVINKFGLMITLLAMGGLALTNAPWLIFFVVPFFLGFLEMYITVLVDSSGKKVGRKVN